MKVLRGEFAGGLLLLQDAAEFWRDSIPCQLKAARACSGKVGTGFPSRQTRSVCAEIMRKQRDEIDHDPMQSDRIMISGPTKIWARRQPPPRQIVQVPPRALAARRSRLQSKNWPYALRSARRQPICSMARPLSKGLHDNGRCRPDFSSGSCADAVRR